MHEYAGSIVFGQAFRMYHQPKGSWDFFLFYDRLSFFERFHYLYKCVFEHINKAWMIQLGDLGGLSDN